ncbi:MAG: type II toxin-antitoxin system prevent-host-death family antitoxin [Alphaproteobacteria bacterium]
MTRVGVLDAKNRLSALLDEVEQGERIVITRRGAPVARLVPFRIDRSSVRARTAADRILRRSRTMRLDGLRIADLIDEGRS